MASFGSSSLVPVKRSTTSSSPLATKRSCLASPPILLGSSVGVGFNSLPPLPIILKPFDFLKSIDLTTVAWDLYDVPVKSGWELVLFKLVVEQPRSEDVFKSGVELGGWGIESKSVPDVSGFKTGVEPISDVG